MPERRQNLARMNRARLHTLSPELTAARKKKFFFRSIETSVSGGAQRVKICWLFRFRGSACGALPCVLPGAAEPRKADTRRWLSGGSRRMKLQLCPTPEAHGASAFFRQKPPAEILNLRAAL